MSRTLVSPTLLSALFSALSSALLPTLLGALAGTAGARKPALPPTPTQPVTDEYHGVKVVDDYRWLENIADAPVKAWSDAQTAYARAYLDRRPTVAALTKRITAIEDQASVEFRGLQAVGKTLFAVKAEPGRQQPTLVVLASPDDPASARTVVDPNALDPGGTTTIDFYVPSLDARHVAVSLSVGGSEDGTVHVFEVATGKELVADAVPRVNGGTAGGGLAWAGDGKGFYYTRYPRGQERPPEDMGFYQQVWFHRLGTPTAKDTYSLGKDFPRIAEIELFTSDDGKWVLCQVANGDGGEYAYWVAPSGGAWKQVSRFADEVVGAAFGQDAALYLLSRQGAPRGRILRLPLATPALARAAVVVPEGEGAISGFLPAARRLYVEALVGGPSELRVYPLGPLEPHGPHGGPDDEAGRLVPTLPVSAVGGLVRLEGDEILFHNESFIDPPAWYRYRPAAAGGRDEVAKTALAVTPAVDMRGVEVTREFAASKDGTRVPINLITRKGARRAGRNPTVLSAYGGYGISLTPRFDARVAVWLEQGGVYAIANLRGGGEYGEAWHRAGNLTRKQNVFDDFTACARWLIDAKVTSPKKLAILGGSNGGLLMGAALTQHPELYGAVVSYVGIYDMLRVELSPNGAFNVTEFGTVKDPEHFKAMHAYSPYHHVVDQTRYPAVLLTTGENDPRVDPMQSRKMTARLQAATGSRSPILLVTNTDAGHGAGSRDQRIRQRVYMFAFLMDQLGMTYRAPRSAGTKDRAAR